MNNYHTPSSGAPFQIDTADSWVAISAKYATALTPSELFHAIWQMVKDTIFDQSKLAHWSQWQLYFDQRVNATEPSDRIDDSENNALCTADEMLVSLADGFTFLRDSDERAHRESLADQQGAVGIKHLNNNIGYLHIKSFVPDDLVWQLRRGFARLVKFDALIVDLRDNEGGNTDQAVESAALFLNEGTVVSYEERVPEAGYMRREIRLVTDKQIIVDTDLATGEQIEHTEKRQPLLVDQQPIVLLVNKVTASAAELFAGALLDRVTVFGTKTRGKGIGQRCVPICDQAELQITTMRYFSPKGTWFGDGAQTVANGINPNITVESQHGSAEDIQLAQALAYLEELLNKH
jgi:Peptidase family S41